MRSRHTFWIGLATGALLFGAVSYAQRTGITSPSAAAAPPLARVSQQDTPTTNTAAPRFVAAQAEDDGKLRIIAFGAHPDDCEIRVGGCGALWSDGGHHVKFVSATNGDIGHWREAGGPLALRRLDEVTRADRLLGVTTRVLDIHDGELMPTLENRRTFIREIRDWNADVVLSHRPNDYHPDHRYTGVLVQDSAFMVAVPFICPDAPPLQKNPVFLFYDDRFEKPTPFAPDIVVSIDEAVERKLDALAIMESQFFEGGALGNASLIPNDEEGREQRRRTVRENFQRRFARIADTYRDKLVELYGEDKGNKISYAEAFEVCEYGRQPTDAELRALFPFVE